MDDRPRYRAVARTLLRELYSDMRLREAIVAASELDRTFVRPAHIVDEPATGRASASVPRPTRPRPPDARRLTVGTRRG